MTKIKFAYPFDMDKECVRLCNAMNNIDGIHTIQSCSGHKMRDLEICFLSDKFDGLSKIAHAIYVQNNTVDHLKIHVRVECNDVGDLFFVLIVPLSMNYFSYANSLAYLLEDDDGT